MGRNVSALPNVTTKGGMFPSKPKSSSAKRDFPNSEKKNITSFYIKIAHILVLCTLMIIMP